MVRSNIRSNALSAMETPALLHFMHGHDQRAELRPLEILDFVNQERNGSLPLFRGFGHRDKEIGEIDLGLRSLFEPSLAISGEF